MNSDKLRKYFKQFGTVQDAVVMKDPVSKRSRGFGFVTYTDIAGVDCALSGDAHTIDSRKVFIYFYVFICIKLENNISQMLTTTGIMYILYCTCCFCYLG